MVEVVQLVILPGNYSVFQSTRYVIPAFFILQTKEYNFE